jgi:carboxypeptidase Taq
VNNPGEKIVKMMASSSTPELYGEYREQMHKIADIKNAIALLQWDQETYMPSQGTSFRAQQIATLSEQAHRQITKESMGNLLMELSGRNGLREEEKANLRLSLEDYNKQRKYPAAFVRTLSETSSRSLQSWINARKENRFAVFERDLDELIQLKKQETELLGYSGHPYNALPNEFEKDCTVDLMDRIFKEISLPLKELLDRITAKKQVDDRFLHQFYDRQEQWDFGIEIIRLLGFDFEAGRQDISEHPFTTSFSCRDVRITTRIDEQDLGNMIWSCMHETGHALYEQGLPETQYGLPLGEYASLGIHESQSRLWENQVGRSLLFWGPVLPRLKKIFPVQLDGLSPDGFFKGINKVEPSLIRTQADELTYHFHVMIRYELEKLLISGGLLTADIPAWWNEQYKTWLGVQVPDDLKGCLQDVHWSHGSFGYFSTYSLGSFYAAQFFESAEVQVQGLRESLGKAQTKPLLDWLRIYIHRFGRQFTSEELCQKLSGKTLDIQCFLRYLLDKYRIIYEF